MEMSVWRISHESLNDGQFIREKLGKLGLQVVLLVWAPLAAARASIMHVEKVNAVGSLRKGRDVIITLESG